MLLPLLLDPAVKGALRSVLYFLYVLLYSFVTMRAQLEEDWSIAAQLAALEEEEEGGVGGGLSGGGAHSMRWRRAPADAQKAKGGAAGADVLTSPEALEIFEQSELPLHDSDVCRDRACSCGRSHSCSTSSTNTRARPATV